MNEFQKPLPNQIEIIKDLDFQRCVVRTLRVKKTFKNKTSNVRAT